MSLVFVIWNIKGKDNKEKNFAELNTIDLPNLTSGMWKVAPSPLAGQLQNRIGDLLQEEKQNVAPVEASKLSMHKPHIIDRRQWQGTVVVSYHLWWTEASICLLGLLSRSIRGLPGAQIQDAAEELPGILGYHSPLLIHMGANNAARGDHWNQECLQGSESEGQEL